MSTYAQVLGINKTRTRAIVKGLPETLRKGLYEENVALAQGSSPSVDVLFHEQIPKLSTRPRQLRFSSLNFWQTVGICQLVE